MAFHRKALSRLRILALLMLLVALPSAAQWWSPDRVVIKEPSNPVSKTVGTVDGICTNDSSIVVPSGTTVYYCYSLIDPPPANYSYNVTDDILGLIALNGNGAVNQTFEVFRSQRVFANVTNIGTFSLFLDRGLSNSTRGGFFEFTDNATVGVVDNGSGGFGNFNPAIPTLSEIAMFSFGILLIGGAFLVLRRTA